MKKEFRSFEDAKKFVQKLGLKRQKDWEGFCKYGGKPQDIPRNPYRTYKNKGWNGMGDWLGTGRVATNDISYQTFKESRKFVQKLGLKSGSEWAVYCKSGKKPQDIPYNAKKVYKNEWKGMGDWLGTGTIASYNMVYRPFKEAKKFAQTLNLKTNKDWSKFCKTSNKPDDIPNAPEHQYKNKGWTSWGDFLGTGRVANYNKTYRSFNEAREFAQQLGLKSVGDWSKFCKSGKKPDDIPTAPTGTYKKDWKNWGDWLGTGTIAPQNRKYRSFSEAKKFVRSLKLKNSNDWENYCKSGKKPVDIPSAPWLVYKEWKKIEN